MNTDARLAAAPVGVRRQPPRTGEHLPDMHATPLQRAIIALAEQGCATPCADNDMWTASDRKTRLEAELWCVGCPVLAECGTDADEHHITFGTWGGRDRTLGRWSA